MRLRAFGFGRMLKSNAPVMAYSTCRLGHRCTPSQVRFAGWARMALPLQTFKLKEIRKPAVGELKPASATAEVVIDVKTLRHDVRREWDDLKQHDVLFLLTIRPPTQQEVEAMTANGRVPGVMEKYGLVYVRGCEVRGMAHTHTHTHTHTDTHTDTHTHTHTLHTQTATHTHTQTRAHTHTHTHIILQTYLSTKLTLDVASKGKRSPGPDNNPWLRVCVCVCVCVCVSYRSLRSRTRRAPP